MVPFKKINIKLSRRIAFVIFLFTVIPLIAVSMASYMHSAGALRDAFFAKLQAVLRLKCNWIIQLFESWERDVLDIASHPYISTGLAELSAGFRELGAEGARSLYLGREDLDDAGDDSEYSTAHHARHGFFVRYAAIRRYEGIFLIDLEGNIIYATRKDESYGTNLLSGPFAGSSLAELYKQLRTAPVGKTYTSDAAPFSEGTIAMFIGTPCYLGGKPIGIIAFQGCLELISGIMQQREGMGETGETYLVGSDLRMRSDSILDPEQHSIAASFERNYKMDNLAINEGLAGRSGTAVIQGHRGVPVLSAYIPLRVLGLDWVAIAEKEVSEALDPAKALRNILLAIAGILTTFFTFLGILGSRRFTKPVEQLNSTACVLAGGGSGANG